MNVFNWLTGHFSNRRKSLWLHKRGMARAKKHDYQGAIDDYTKTIGIPHTLADVKAVVLYNRALVYLTAGEDRKGVNDLDAVLATDEASVNLKTLARQRLARIESQSCKSTM